MARCDTIQQAADSQVKSWLTMQKPRLTSPHFLGLFGIGPLIPSACKVLRGC